MKEEYSSRARLATVAGLLGAHSIAYVACGLKGYIDPFEFFNVLLLAGNFAIGAVLLRGRHDLLLGGGTMLLVAAHAFIGQRLVPQGPDGSQGLDSGALLMVSIVVLYVGVKVNTLLPARYWYALVASYLLLFFIFVRIRWGTLFPALGEMGVKPSGMANAVPLLMLFLLGLAACARSFRLLAYFWAIVLSFTFCQPYAWEAVLIAFFSLTAVFSARGRAPSRTAIVFLSCGLALTFLVLFPVVAIVRSESLHSMVRVAEDPGFREAVWTTLKTATISTLFLVVFTVPLAYAVSRLRFRGRTLLLSLIDVPIVIPQSVAAIALLRVFGENQFLGELFSDYFGIKFSGALPGICLAQVFVAMPFITRSAVAAFDAVPERLELAARTLGASSWGAFWRIALPLASRGVFLGAVLAWARAAGEFGALMLIAQNPRTAPMEVYYKFQGVGAVQAAPMGAALLLFSLAMFFLLQFVSRTLPSVHGTRERLL